MPAKNPDLDRPRNFQPVKGQWSRLQKLSKQHRDLDMRPTEMLRRCLEVGLRAAERGEIHEPLVSGCTDGV